MKCRYIKSAAAHRSNLVSYIGTREGVDKNIEADRPATKKQEEMIARLLRSAPDAKDTFEYEDYIANPTAKNASEFIEQALEQNADRFADRKIFLEYIANRPRVQKLGAHGLFSDTDDAINLSRVQQEVAEHPGNVWTNVVSLRREDAARLGYDNATAWRSLMREKRNDIAACMKIEPENLKWYAAFHDEGIHPHIHFIAYSTDPKEAYLTKDGIDGIRSCLAREIFQQDLLQIYSEQTVRRDTLNRESLSVMREMCEKMQNGVCDNPRIGELMQTLADRLSKTGGKKQYGYLKADVKAIVDSIVDELVKDSRVAACYDAWYEMRNQVLQTYADKVPDPLPLSQQKEFKAIKNMVISEAMRLGSFDSPVIINDAPVITDTEIPNSEPDFFVEPDGAPDYQEEGMPDDDPEYRVEWSDQYKLAREFLFGTKTIAPDFDEAHALLLMEAEDGNALAMHDLGRMHADGLGRDSDAEAAHDWYAKALDGFLAVESATHKPYIQYRIGKMYAAGLGQSLSGSAEQDYEKAAEWFSSAAQKNHKYAQYSLGGLYYRGQGVAQDYERAFGLYEKSSAQENAYASYELAKMLRDGIGCAKDLEQANIHFKTAFEGFQSMEADRSDDRLQYRLGQMLRDGIGTEPDAEQARLYFEASAKLGNPHAQYALAKMIIEAGGEPEKIAEAVSWLQKSSDGGNQFAQYTLGKFYRDGEHMEKDIPKAVEFLTLAAEQENEFAQYALGKLYLDGGDIEKDIPAATRWLTASAEQGNQFAQYTLGKLFLSGEDVQKDIPAAIHWLTKSAEQDNQFAQYALGKLYLEGNDIPKDVQTAVRWFTKSADQGNQFAQYTLGKLYLVDTDIEKDVQAAICRLTEAAEQSNQFAQYQLGKLYLLDRDVLRDREQAVHWFTLSAAQGNEYAQFFLDHMDEFHDPSLLFSASQLLRNLSKLFEDQQQKQTAQADHIDRKRMRELRQKMQAQGHAHNEQIQNY